MFTSKHLLCLALLGGMLGHGAAVAQLRDASPATLEEARAKALEPLIAQRQQYPEMFKNAYARYPSLPAGSLEAIAHAQTGWRNVNPALEDPGHRHMPLAYGVMGLYQGDGFADQVAEGARLTGLSKAQVASDPQASIMAAAALLEQAFAQERKAGTKSKRGEEAMLAAALQRYAGFGEGDGNIQSYARESFAYVVLSGLAYGVQEQGVKIPRHALDMTKAFAPERLRLLQAPVLTMNHDRDSIAFDGAAPATAPKGVDETVAAKATVDFSEAIWNAASGYNYSTSGNSASAVIMHTIEGSYAGAISWFKNASAQVSAHYVIRKSDGQITQMVREHHQAWHAAYHNHYTIGIEHDGYASAADNWSSAMVNASARLTRSICARRGVNCAAAWQGPGYSYWNVVPDSVRIKGHGMLTSNQNRYDPGQYFPWANFYTLINGGTAPPPPPAPGNVRYWVDTWANAPGYASSTSTAQTGTLYQGTSYVYCKTWGREVRSGTSFNRWWLKTDLDVGPGNQYVSAFYLSRWGNDEARDNDGYDLPRCEVLPYGKIGEKYYAMGGIRSVLGVPKLAEMASQLNGRFQEFNNGIILWHSRTGAFAIRGAILQHFWATNSETRWGFALMDEMNAAKSPVTAQQGRYQYFENGLFLWTPSTGAHAVYGAILTHFETTGREARYGYPKAEEQAWGTAGGRKQVFEKGTFYWTPQQGVFVQ
ncbi:MAG: N-acetylmuramoyl-L-alanine amidase [Lysobacteraceae bacterium]